MGTSFTTRQPVLTIIDRLPATLELTFTALIGGSLIGIGLGIAAARKQQVRRSHPRFFVDRVLVAGLLVWAAGVVRALRRLGWFRPGRL